MREAYIIWLNMWICRMLTYQADGNKIYQLNNKSLLNYMNNTDMHDKITNFSFSLLFLPGECGCGCSDVSLVASEAGPLNAPTNGSKTAHTKVATSGGHANTQAPSKRSSSGADGDYHLVQHEVLYSLLAEYEVRSQPKTFPFSPNYSTSYKNNKKMVECIGKFWFGVHGWRFPHSVLPSIFCFNQRIFYNFIEICIKQNVCLHA